MKKFFKNFILKDISEIQHKRIILEIGFLNSEFYPLLTEVKRETLKQYYLFNKIKCFEKRERKNG